MTLLIQLILAHLLGDFLLQPNKWVALKERKKIKAIPLYLHILLHIALILLITWDLHFWKAALLLGGIHGAIDLLKIYAQRPGIKRLWFFIDQLLHLISLLAVWYYVTPDAGLWMQSYFTTTNLLYFTAYLFVTVPAAVIIKVIISRWQPDLDIKSSRITETPGAYNQLNKTPAQAPQSLQDAGKYIGMLERVFILTFLLAGHWEAIGFLLAAKSIFRFSDLKEAKDRKLTEYIIIGTFVSVGMAIGIGLLLQHMLSQPVLPLHT